MRRALALVAGGLGVLVLLSAAFYGVLRLMRGQGPFWAEAWRVLFGVPLSLERVLMAAAVVLAIAALLLAPLSLAERRSERAFAARAEELRRERPEDAVTPYAGAEGEGLAFDGPAGRLLLLRGERGLGEPRVVDLPAPGDAAPPAERPSP
ncbi:MAG TPA: hypothetical protein VNX21_02945, partial [Candidatus Thermoplasmatota archaeon]|nr:hypothetical protein [Candidatus Thermoplasmatota archaeon]